MLWLDFFDQFLKLWAVILERRNIFSKNFLAQIIIFDKYFGWFDVQLNQKILDDLYYICNEIHLKSQRPGQHHTFQVQIMNLVKKGNIGSCLFVLILF